MLAQPFLTDLDTRAEVRGSVDPLGAMAIWTRLGRRVVGNLSTVTSSVRDFKTLVLGFAFLADLRRRAGPEEDVDELATFLRWEQLAAYTRASSGDWAFRGVRAVGTLHGAIACVGAARRRSQRPDAARARLRDPRVEALAGARVGRPPRPDRRGSAPIQFGSEG